METVVLVKTEENVAAGSIIGTDATGKKWISVSKDDLMPEDDLYVCSRCGGNFEEGFQSEDGKIMLGIDCQLNPFDQAQPKPPCIQG